MFFKNLFKKDKYTCFYGTRQYGKTNYELRKEIEKLKNELEVVNTKYSILCRRVINANNYINNCKYVIEPEKISKILSGEHYKTFNDMIERNSKNGKQRR